MKHSKLGEQLKQARKQQGMTQELLSQLSGAGISAIYKLEKGDIGVTLQNFLSITQCLGIKVDLNNPFGESLTLNE